MSSLDVMTVDKWGSGTVSVVNGGGCWRWVVRLQYQRGVCGLRFHYRTVVVVNRWGYVSVASGYCRTTVGVRYRVIVGRDDCRQVGVGYRICCQWWWVLAVGYRRQHQASVSRGMWTHRCRYWTMVGVWYRIVVGCSGHRRWRVLAVGHHCQHQRGLWTHRYHR